MWKLLKIQENSFLTSFTMTGNIANYILYDIAKNDVYAEVSEVEHLLHRAEKINSDAPFDIDLPLLVPSLLDNDPIFVDILTREANTPYLSLRLKYPIHNVNVDFNWHLRPINIAQFQQLIMDPCLSVLHEMYTQVTKLITALNRNKDRLKLYQCQPCKNCGHRNKYSDLVSKFDDKQLDEFDREFLKVKYVAESFMTLGYHLNKYRHEIKTTGSNTSGIDSCFSKSSFNTSLNDDCSQTTIVSMRDLNESLVADKGKDIPVDKRLSIVEQSNDECCNCIEDYNQSNLHEVNSEVCLAPSMLTIIAEPDRTQNAVSSSRDQSEQTEPMTTTKMKDSVGSNKFTTLYEPQSTSAFENYNSSGRSSDESNIDEAIKQFPTKLIATIKQDSVNRSNNHNATRIAGADGNQATVQKMPHYTWALNKSKGIMEFQKIPNNRGDVDNSEDDEEACNRQQYLKDRDRRWRLLEHYRPIYSDEYISASSAQEKSFGEVIDSFERLVDTRICTLNNSHIPHCEEDRSKSYARYKTFSQQRRSDEKTVSFNTNNNEIYMRPEESASDTLSAKSSTCTLCECASCASIPQSFGHSQGQILDADTDTEPVASTSSALIDYNNPNMPDQQQRER